LINDLINDAHCHFFSTAISSGSFLRHGPAKAGHYVKRTLSRQAGCTDERRRVAPTSVRRVAPTSR
jgi:hypothetical protein